MPLWPHAAFATFVLLIFVGCQPGPSGEDASVQFDGGADASVDGGNASVDSGIPHPAGCGDRRGPGLPHHDTLATCPLLADTDWVRDGGSLLQGEPVLVLGDDAVFVTPGSSTAALVDLHRGREKLTLNLAGTYVANSAVANTIGICMLVTSGSTQLQCFDRNLGNSLWTLPIAFGTVILQDLQLRNVTLWLAYTVVGAGELMAINLVTGQVLWRRAPLDGTGRLVRAGDHFVGYDEQPCAELTNPDACLRAVDATTGQVRATFAARYVHFVWQSGTRAVFSDDTAYVEYDASTSMFRDVTTQLAPLLAGLGASRLYPQGEALPDGRVLVNAGAAGVAGELVVIDPTTLTFQKLGLSPPPRMRIHGEVLITDSAVVSLTAIPAPAVSPRLWFGIFGFKAGEATWARKLQ